ncbi:MAG: glycosyltransferase family 61 protein [Sphingobacteriaceae bacterium]|nr:MAG: glycosyltransferase family 61 protein [Sphingobacteriaceae bacterium]
MKGIAKKILNSLTGELSIVLPAKFEVEAEVAVPLTRGSHVLPVNIDTIPMPLQGNFNVLFELPEVYVYELKNVYVRYDGIIYKNFSVFEPSLPAYWFKASFEHAPLLKQYYKAEKVNTDKDPIIVFHDMWSDNYYHWLIDALPRLLLLDSSKKKYRVGIPYYNSTKDYVKLTVDALGFTNHYIFQLDQTVSVDRVILPGRTAYGIDQNPTLLRSLREKLVAALEINKVQAHKNIFVSRGRAKTRRLKNEHEIIGTLIKHNFEIVYFEELSFLEQFVLMRETKIMVGVHGANLANSLFMQPGCILVELINRQHPNLVYYHMASNLQLPYFSIPCVPDSVNPQTSDSSKIFDPNLNNADYYVEPSLFSAVLDECVNYAK